MSAGLFSSRISDFQLTKKEKKYKIAKLEQIQSKKDITRTIIVFWKRSLYYQGVYSYL